MAHEIEEAFVSSHVKAGTVFEFGAGNGHWASTRPDLNITTIDLYPRPDNCPSNLNYIQGNFLDRQISSTFDYVVALSAIEHAGIETLNFQNKSIDLHEHISVLVNLSSLVKPGGKLIVTVPAGPNEIMITHTGKPDSPYDGTLKGNWGYRTFTLDGLLRVVPPGMKLLEAKAYCRIMHDDYFDIGQWAEMSMDHIKFLVEHGLLCVALEKPHE